METQLLGKDDIARAALLLKEGHLVAFPTETVYGLGAPIFEEKAVGQIFVAKGRPPDNPLIAHVSDLSQILEIAREIPPFFEQLTDAFFPGPLTLILKRHPRVPAIVSGGLDTVAVRMPDHVLAQALIKAVGQPLVAPSANLSGRPSSTEASHVLHDFSGRIAAVIDGGKTEHGMESTVLSLLGEKPVLLRPGALTLAAIEAVLGEKILVGGAHAQGSPGMKYRHYAPNIPVRIFSTVGAIKDYLEQNYALRCLVLKPEEITLEHQDCALLDSQHLYAHLRLAETSGFHEILIYHDENTCLDLALSNRILRAGQLE